MDFAFRDDRCGVGQNTQDVQATRLDHQREGAREQEVPDQNGSIIAPDIFRRLFAAAEITVIDNIVV